MAHLTDRDLQQLIVGAASTVDVQRIRRHVEECRPCARRLEEWRDNFSEVEERFPELGLEAGPAATVTSDGLVLLPRGETRRRFEPDLTSVLWVGAVAMALLVGYGVTHMSRAKGGTAVAVNEAPVITPAAVNPAPMPAQSVPAARPVRDSHPVAAPTAPPPQPNRPPVSGAVSAGAAAQSPTRSQPSAESEAVSPKFKRIGLGEAARRLGGPVRLLQGLDPDHVEIGAASAVPGAQSKLPVVRVVYRAPGGGRITLDQQLIPEDSSGFRSIEDPTLESGQTAYGTTAAGANRATWLDDEGYCLSLATQAPLDSLKRLVELVR
ncbi:MAG TPA: hypothetical protein VH879_10845 [Gemmatimonadales bacterium]|jgi:hypothetical protein